MANAPARSTDWTHRLQISGLFGLAACISTIIFWYFFIGLTSLNHLYDVLKWSLYSSSSALLSSLLLTIIFDEFQRKKLTDILLVSAAIVFLSYLILPITLSAVTLVSTGSLSGMRNVIGSLFFVFIFTSWITFPMGLLTGYLIYRSK